MPVRKTLKDAQELAKTKGGKCLDEEYVNTGTKMEWECEVGHKWNATYDSINYGSWCPECNGTKRKTLKNAQELAKEKGGTCLSEKYINSGTKMLWQCNKGHEPFLMSYNQIQQNYWCSVCTGRRRRKTLKDMHEIAKKHGGKCLSTEYKNAHTKILWQCNKGHGSFLMTYCNVLYDHWCPTCGLEKVKEKQKLPNGLEKAQELAKKRNGVCLSEEYINNKNNMLWQCDQNHKPWKAPYDRIQSGSWCPRCSMSKTQAKLLKIISKLLNEKSLVNHRPGWLRNPNTGHNLELDGHYSVSLVSIEYQGEDHFMPIDRGQGKEQAKIDFKLRKERDAIKKILISNNPDKVKHFLIFTYKDVITEETIKERLVKEGIIK